MTNFDLIAPVYDALAAMVYGQSLRKAKTCFAAEIKPNAKVLVLGGGTGAILNAILRHTPDTEIDFVEPSKNFIALAGKKLLPRYTDRVNFICGDHHAIPEGKQYDAFTTLFVVDCFTEEEALAFCTMAAQHLKHDGMWLFADFVRTKNIFQRALIWFMYRFFRMLTGVSGSRLPDYDSIFSNLNFKVLQTKSFYGGMIESKVLQKTIHLRFG